MDTYPNHYSTPQYNDLVFSGTNPDEIAVMEQFMIYNNFHWDFNADRCCLYQKNLNIPEEQERDFD